MWRSHKHDDQFGPFASAHKNTGEEKPDVDGPSSSDKLESRLGNRSSGIMSPEPYEGNESASK
jgi:hypothetical protein